LADLTGLEKRLGVHFKDRSLLEQALVHPSFVNENPAPGLVSNERLEFLGDAVLGAAIAELLFEMEMRLSEGEMTQLKAALVKRDTLAGLASELALGDYLKLGRGEEASGGRRRPANLANALEAVVGAIFQDAGWEAARDFVTRILGPRLGQVVAAGGFADYKSRLQELAQARFGITPTYRVIQDTGPPHQRHFTVEVRIGDEAWGVGEGPTKRGAEMEAARQALEGLSPGREALD